MMKRYRIDPVILSGSIQHGMTIGAEPVEDEDGRFVEFTDHQAEIAKRDAMLIAAKDYLLRKHFDDAQAVLIAGNIITLLGFSFEQKTDCTKE